MRRYYIWPAKQLRVIFVLALSVSGTVFAWSSANAASIQCSTAPVDRWLIVPNKCIGMVPWTGSGSDFNRAFGARRVKHADRFGSINAEDETAPGLILFPDDSLKSVNIVSKDPVHRRGVDFCYLQYLKFNRPPRLGYWHLASGTTLGMDIHTLERMNHRTFTIRLTNIDVRQGVDDWQGGGFANEGALVGLDADEGDHHIDRDFEGTRIVWSSDRGVQAAWLWIDYIAP